MSIHWLIAFTSILFSGTIYAQSARIKADSAYTISNKEFSSDAKLTKIKWTWQLPSKVISSFNRTQYTHWFIEKIISFNSNGKTIYRFNLDNGNLLDGDHYDNFLKTRSLYISYDGTILHN